MRLRFGRNDRELHSEHTESEMHLKPLRKDGNWLGNGPALRGEVSSADKSTEPTGTQKWGGKQGRRPPTRDECA